MPAMGGNAEGHRGFWGHTRQRSGLTPGGVQGPYGMLRIKRPPVCYCSGPTSTVLKGSSPPPDGAGGATRQSGCSPCQLLTGPVRPEAAEPKTQTETLHEKAKWERRDSTLGGAFAFLQPAWVNPRHPTRLPEHCRM